MLYLCCTIQENESEGKGSEAGKEVCSARRGGIMLVSDTEATWSVHLLCFTGCLQVESTEKLPWNRTLKGRRTRNLRD